MQQMGSISNTSHMWHLRSIGFQISVGAETRSRTSQGPGRLPGFCSGDRVPAKLSSLAEVRVIMRRVVVTGLGVVAPNGVGKEAFWSACCNGLSGVGRIRSFDAGSFPVRIAAEVNDFDVSPFLPETHRKSLKVMSRPM